MTLRHLKIFVTVYQHKSITRAAEELYISQPAVSLAIKELEDTYELRFFERLNKKLYITHEGHNFYEYASRIVTLYDEMDETFLEKKNQNFIHLGFGIAVGKLIMPKIIHKFQSEHPDITIKVSVFNSQTIEDMIVSNQIDIGMLEGSVHEKHLIREVVQINPIVVICNKKNPLTHKKSLCIEDLANENFLMREAYSDTRVAIDSIFKSHKIEIQPLWESVSSLALLNAVSENLGITFLPLNIVSALSDENITILDVKDFNPVRNLNIIYHKDKYISPVLRQFIDFCKKTEK